eukprot:837821-Amphidinium_carterae.2
MTNPNPPLLPLAQLVNLAVVGLFPPPNVPKKPKAPSVNRRGKSPLNVVPLLILCKKMILGMPIARVQSFEL